ncbi:MAG: hypothetical protein BWX99_03031 [Deltaproteobacteria bacterium ADurb.Bin151]|nr:MAG: hypothetical protein BWX99_03031 [Deltaproteobacteria bacterium ADurb.Bin151]
MKDKTRRRFFHYPGNVRVGIQSAQGRKRRQRVNDIADGAEFDNQNIHVRFSSIQWTASKIFSAIWSGLASGVS